VWEGDRPANDAAALAEFERLWAHYFESAEDFVPTERIADYVRALLERYPDLDDDDDSPWSTSPLMSEASGQIIYFPMVWSRCEEVSAWAADLAKQHGLNCFDPQSNQLRTPFRE
jgi:hypothetical protein